jgi:hypothetical protein
VHFELVSAIAEVVTIAAGRGVRDLTGLRGDMDLGAGESARASLLFD